LRILTGIKPTGALHLGNYVGAMRPALRLLKDKAQEAYLFIADGHALTGAVKGKELRAMTHHVAAAYLAVGLDPERVVFYRQSALREVFELFWLLSCVCPKGLMNRAHAYKAIVQDRLGDKDPDRDVWMGLYNYPILMAADILLFSADEVPVGPDQVQHVEIARDLALKFNQRYGECLKLPRAFTPKETPVLVGLDGRKMSKSYGNTIGLFADEATLRKLIFRIKTNSQRPEEPKEFEMCALFGLFSAFAGTSEILEMKNRYAQGIGWAEMKEITFNTVNTALKPLRAAYEVIMQSPEKIEAFLQKGEEKARHEAAHLMQQVRLNVGFGSLDS